VQVLFIGNSYTFVNNMPEMFASLVRDAGYNVRVEMTATGGWTLADHVASQETRKLIAEGTWDYVVLQEQSVIPSVAQRRTTEMSPAARVLVDQIHAAGGQPLLFMTWGRRDGLPDYGFDNFTSMQAQLQSGYTKVAESLDTAVVPVGLAWQRRFEENSAISLWDSDGSHPSVEGSYLTACVFYAFIVEESPIGLEFTAGLHAERALQLQRTASKTVFPSEQ
jgi:hypothetical protein